MKTVLQIALAIGIGLLIIGGLNWLSLQPALDKQPAIVIVPQLIQAVLIGGFGLLTAAVSAAGIALLAAAEALAEQMRTAARPAQSPREAPGISTPTAAPPGLRPLPGLPPGVRSAQCIHCNATMDALARKCPNCQKLQT